MPFISDEAFDAGLDYLDTNGTRIDINYTSEPTTYAEAVTSKSCGNDTVATPAPEAGATDGRRVIVPAITAGTVSATQTADWWSLTDGSSLFLAAGDLTTPQGVTSGNTFSLDAISITFRDAT